MDVVACDSRELQLMMGEVPSHPEFMKIVSQAPEWAISCSVKYAPFQ